MIARPQQEKSAGHGRPVLGGWGPGGCALLVALLTAAAAACASPCPPCRCVAVETEEAAGSTLPYTLEMDDEVACDVVSARGQPERLRCYCVDPVRVRDYPRGADGKGH